MLHAFIYLVVVLCVVLVSVGPTSLSAFPHRYKSNSSLLMSDALVQPSITSRLVTVSNTHTYIRMLSHDTHIFELFLLIYYILVTGYFIFKLCYISVTWVSHILCVLLCVFQAPQSLQCGVCLQVVRRDSLLALPCQHSFCKACWEQHCTVLVKDGMGVGKSSVWVWVCVCGVIEAAVSGWVTLFFLSSSSCLLTYLHVLLCV